MADLDAKTLSELSAKVQQQKKEIEEQRQQSRYQNRYMPIIEGILSDNAFDIKQIAMQGGFCHQFSVNSNQLENVDDLNDFAEFTKTYLVETKGYKECEIIRTFDIANLIGLLFLAFILSAMISFLGCSLSSLISIKQDDDLRLGFFVFVLPFTFLVLVVVYYCEFYKDRARDRPLNPLAVISPKKPLSIYLAWR